MKNCPRIPIATISILLASSALAAYPFLDAKDDKPVSANFRGTEWNDENIQGEIPLTARVITTRTAQMSWGSIFKIEFVDLKSRAKEHREIPPPATACPIRTLISIARLTTASHSLSSERRKRRPMVRLDARYSNYARKIACVKNCDVRCQAIS